MANYKRLTVKNARDVLARIADQIDADKTAAQIWCATLNATLDELLFDDFFGTEGQNDPRGDHRD